MGNSCEGLIAFVLQMSQERDHIFISYATEQSELCDWLARKLASEGYAVWYDRLKLLGGEDWPSDIDKAIKERTFRMLALLSRESVAKPNPIGEWLTGRAVGRELGIDDFLLSLNTDGLTSLEIPWNFQTINYISFHPSWANGLEQLLKKLEDVKAPRLLSEGRQLAIRSTSVNAVVSQEPELLMSNCFQIKQLPRFVSKYRTNRRISRNERWKIQQEWACWHVGSFQFLAFHEPPKDVTERHDLQSVGEFDVVNVESMDGTATRSVVVNLIHRSLEQLMKSKGLERSGKSGDWYLPDGLLQGNRVWFKGVDGKRSWFSGVGERKFPTRDGGEVYRYHIAPSFSHDRVGVLPNHLTLRIRIYLTGPDGRPLAPRKSLSRRKHLCKWWFNREWSARILGMMQLLADENHMLRCGTNSEQQLVIDSMPMTLTSDKGLYDALVGAPNDFLLASDMESDADFYDN